MSHDDRLGYQSRIDELSQTPLVIDPLRAGKNYEVRTWERLQASAQPGLDASGKPVLQMRVGDHLAQVGLARTNILSDSESSALAARLLEARLRQELRPATARKSPPSDVKKDLALLQQLLSP